MKDLQLPKELEQLKTLAKNYWWSWNQECYELFKAFSPETWQKTRTPFATLKDGLENFSEKVQQLAQDKEYLELLNKTTASLEDYITNAQHPKYKVPQNINGEIAYFCAEYGIHESLPIYSGGLGVLAGDHVKSASDLGLPMLFVGLYYKNGYFTQEIDQEGQQQDIYHTYTPQELGLSQVTDTQDRPLLLSVKLAQREVKVQVWKAQVGRVPLYLLDSNVEGNSQEDKDMTARLYGGDHEMRISQEIILGIGGIKMLEALDIHPKAYHMNEGHSGFFQLERIKNEMKRRNLSFEEAKILCASNCLFTTHTPVPAGNEAFTLPLMHKFFHDYIKELDISWHRFVGLGLVEEKTDHKFFSLTVFAINVSRFYNGVSALHGQIAKRMWSRLWKDVPTVDNPITSITNGVHTQTWMAKDTKDLLSKCFSSEWKGDIINQDYWNKVIEIPNQEIKEQKRIMKQKMISLVRERQVAQYERFGHGDKKEEAKSYLDDSTLTIGFARRFATYKRATLIFKDLDRLNKIVNNPEKPVQFIFAGKAHPQDKPGQAFIKEIHQISQRDEFRGKIIILEGYDMNISSHMVSGVDVWLNNPRRPMEASGTSGQKVPINFGLNFSVLDGWWSEGYNEKNGWTIGVEKDYPSDEVQDFEDANDFYNTLEQTIAPLYYDKQDDWIKHTKEAFISTITRYSTDRMVSDYAEMFYDKACSYQDSFLKNDLEKVKSYIEERRFLQRNLSATALSNVQLPGSIEVESHYPQYASSPHHHVGFNVDDTLPGRVFESCKSDISGELYLGDISPKNIKIELVITDRDQDTMVTQELGLVPTADQGLYKIEGNFQSSDEKPRNLRLRYFPTLEGLENKFELGVASWL